jgi:hypothetical protein
MRAFSMEGKTMETYFETAHIEEGEEYATLTAHDTLEEAIEFAEANGILTIYEIGGSWDEFEKCGFCGEWFPSNELNKEGDCFYCEQAIKSHGGI